MTGQVIAYRRVSTIGQRTVRQLDGLIADREFADKVSGSSTERPELMRMLEHIREGDAIHVHSIDRLARNLADLLSIIEQITAVGASITFQKEGLAFDGGNSPMQKMQMQIMGAVAEFERSIINERASEGRAIAQANGVRFGRKPSLTSSQVAKVREAHASGKSIRALAIDYDVGRSTISRAIAN